MLYLFFFSNFISSLRQYFFDFFDPELHILHVVQVIIFLFSLVSVINVSPVVLVGLEIADNLEIAIDADETLLVFFEFCVGEE
jgi:hypothetical protein